MAEDQPGPPGNGNHHERPGQQPTELPGGATQPPSYGRPEGYQQPPPGYEAPQRPPPYAQPPGSAQPGYGYPPPVPQTEGTATAALVIAIVGFFVCLPVGAIVALLMANSAIRRIEASGGRLTGLDQARAARIIAIVELVLVAVVVAVGVIVVAVAVNSGSSPTYAPAP